MPWYVLTNMAIGRIVNGTTKIVMGKVRIENPERIAKTIKPMAV